MQVFVLLYLQKKKTDKKQKKQSLTVYKSRDVVIVFIYSNITTRPS